MQALTELLFRLPMREIHHEGIPVLPGGLPLVGQAPYNLGDALTFLRDAAARVGPLFWTKNLGNYLLVCMGEPGFELLKNRVTSSEFIREQAPDFVGDSLLSRDGVRTATCARP